ncbi:hypothetical protein ATCC90586_011599 [Pythium insidiosum]|nr:hypothetical protein ATCC90586_011599 [Pythium insidiosum]
MDIPMPSSNASVETRFAALTIEPKVLERLVALLPMHSASHAIGDATALLQTVAAICRSLPKDYDYLARHIGPENRAFWQGMVLRCFDFTIDHRIKFNVEDYGNMACCYDSDESELDSDDDMASSSDSDELEVSADNEMLHSCDSGESEFILAAIKEWKAAHPNDDKPRVILNEDLAYWLHFDVFFHPQQYGFLRKIQYGELGLDAWPEHEDPFTLFCDLAFIKDKFPAFRGEMQTTSDGEQFLYPVFLSSYRNEISRNDLAFLQHCGYAPHFWSLLDDPISPCWSGFDAGIGTLEQPTKDSSNDRDDVDDGGDDDDDDDGDDDDDDDDMEVYDEIPFPHARRSSLNDLQALVRRYMDEYRAVTLNVEETPTPIFYIGRMKRSGRWLGFCGQSDHTGYAWNRK